MYTAVHIHVNVQCWGQCAIVYLLNHPEMDAEMKAALDQLNMKVKGKYDHQAAITTDFGKISYTATDLLRVLSDKTYSLDTANPIVREAVAKGSTVFVISTIYEANHSNISVKLVDAESETAGGGAEVHGIGGDVEETVTQIDTGIHGKSAQIMHDMCL